MVIRQEKSTEPPSTDKSGADTAIASLCPEKRSSSIGFENTVSPREAGRARITVSLSEFSKTVFSPLLSLPCTNALS